MNLFKLSLLSILIFFIVPNTKAQSWAQLGQEITGNSYTRHTGEKVSMPDPFTIAVNSKTDTSGQVKVYRLENKVWVQKGSTFKGPSKTTEGSSISMPDSNTIAIGNTFVAGVGNNNQPAGRVQIHYWDGIEWKQKGQTIFGEETGSFLGDAISMPDPNTIAIGNYRHREVGPGPAGAVRIYFYNDQAEEWVQKGTKIIGDTTDYSKSESLGKSVSMPDPNTIAIGAPVSEINGQYSGAVKVYHWVNGDWTLKGTVFHGETRSYLGTDVSMPNANTLAFGVPSGEEGKRGRVEIHQWNNNQWESKGMIKGTYYSGEFGTTVDMSDSNSIAVGTPYAGGGTVQIYNWNSDTWVQQGNTIEQYKGGRCGAAISMPNKNTILVGAFLNNIHGQSSGITKVYSLCDSSGSTISAVSCKSYTSPSGKFIWTTSGTYKDTLTNAANCDSIITVNLTIESLDVSLTQNSSTLTANISDASYQWLDCENNYAAISEETNQSFTAFENGNYAVEISKNGCTDTSSCANIIITAIQDHSFRDQLSLFPNPTDGNLSLKMDATYSEVTLTVTNLLGQVLLIKNYQAVNDIELNIDGQSGIYLVQVKAKDKTAVFKIVKR
ncbi:MAG TPA: T9SS type A sorting domain-containing protein [Chitinophagales bacterium]|nr:T9SS type A sorting domain-containing protein [Chitinophagales bacterium]